MSLIEFDVWLPPVDLSASPDARLSTDDSLTDAGFNPVFLGEGDGFLELHADDSDTQYLQRRGFVRAVRTDTEEAIFDFWLEEADVKILAKKSSDRTIRWSGRGSLYVLDRYRLGQAVYAPDQPNRGSISVIDYWTWLNISPGGIMTRVYEEGFHHPESFYAAATIDFDRVIDSAGLTWVDLTDYQTRIGTSGLQVAADMMRMGLMVRTLPGNDSILIQAFRDLTFTTDRTSGTFAVNKVRFEAGINIAVELPQKIAALQERTHTLTRRQDGQYATETNEGSGEPYMDFMEVPYTSDPAAVEAAVATNHLNRRKQSLVAVVQHRIGAGGASGAAGYFPSPDGHYWPGDLVTVHTGTGEYDLDEQTLQVAGIRYFLRGADWMVQAQLGAQVLTATGAPIAIGGSGPTVPSVPIHFCEPDVEGSEPTLLHSWEFASTGLCSQHGAHEVFNGGLGTGLGGGILNNGVAATGSINGSPSMFPMTAGTSYIIAGRIREYDDDGHTGPAILRIRWRLSDGSEAGNDDVASVSAGWTEDSITVTAPTGTTQAYWEVYRPAAGVHHLLSVDWVRIYADDADTGVERDGPAEIVGTSIKAARCDHNHLLESLLTEETDTALVPHPDGTGGVEWGAGTVGASGGLLPHWETEHRFRIGAHRGDVNPVDGYPEDTLEAVLQAALRGADFIEVDVMPSTDGTWYLMHDNTVDRTTDGTGDLQAKNDAAIAALNIDGGMGYDAGRHGTSLNVPTLESAIIATAPYNTPLVLHALYIDDTEIATLAQYVVEQGITSRVTILAMTLTAAAAVKAVDPSIAVMSYPGATATPETEDDVDSFLTLPTEATSLAYVTARAPVQVVSYMDSTDYGDDETADIQDAFEFGAVGWLSADLPVALGIRDALLHPASAESVKDAGRWEPVQFDDGSSEWPFVYFNGEIVMAWVED